MLALDHVILGAADLEGSAKRLWRDLGLVPVPGGRNVGRGTANRVVPFGSDYLKIVGVVDAEEPRDDQSPAGCWRERLDLARTSWRRRRPHGRELR